MILNQERNLWDMKSRINGLVQGERNTAFYHISALVQPKRNRILAIQNNVDEWIVEERDVMNFIRRGFKDLFTTSISFSHSLASPPSRWQVFLSNQGHESFITPISEEEIKAAL